MLFGGVHTGPNPTDRGKRGCKRHVICDRTVTPLVVWITPANLRDDSATPEGLARLDRLDQQVPTLMPSPPVRLLLGDRGDGLPWLIEQVNQRGWIPLLSPRGADKPPGSGLGALRYVVERTLAWFGSYRRLKLCYERWGTHFQGMHDLACLHLCHGRLVRQRL